MGKTFLKNGKWIDNPNATTVVVCVCGEKYIKTRPRQTHCLRCSADKKMLEKNTKRAKFDFEHMKEGSTHKDAAVRKRTFIEYFERFEEFPSYLFDNETNIDARLYETIQDLLKDPELSKAIRDGVGALLLRLPPPAAA
jgi:hypothetical protein